MNLFLLVGGFYFGLTTSMCFRFWGVVTFLVALDVSGCFRHDVDVDGNRLARLGLYIVSRRVALGYKQRIDLANAIDLTGRTLADIEKGVRPSSPQTYAMLENQLGWKPGSVATILDGGEPAEIKQRNKGEPPALRDLDTGELLDLQADVNAEVQRRYRDQLGDSRINPDAPSV